MNNQEGFKNRWMGKVINYEIDVYIDIKKHLD
jgi:hypothetical protein